MADNPDDLEDRVRIFWLDERAILLLFTWQDYECFRLPFLRGLPADAKIVRVFSEPARRAVAIMVRSEQFPPVRYGACPEALREIEIGFRRLEEAERDPQGYPLFRLSAEMPPGEGDRLPPQLRRRPPQKWIATGIVSPVPGVATGIVSPVPGETLWRGTVSYLDEDRRIAIVARTSGECEALLRTLLADLNACEGRPYLCRQVKWTPSMLPERCRPDEANSSWEQFVFSSAMHAQVNIVAQQAQTCRTLTSRVAAILNELAAIVSEKPVPGTIPSPLRGGGRTAETPEAAAKSGTVGGLTELGRRPKSDPEVNPS